MDYFFAQYDQSYMDKIATKAFELPKRTREVYLLLHQNNFLKLRTIESFSNIDLTSGKVLGSKIYGFDFLRQYKNNIFVFQNSIIDANKGAIKFQNKVYPIASFTILQNGKIVFRKKFNHSSPMHALLYDGRVIFMNQQLYNSFFIQAFLFNNYDRDKFEQVAKSKNFMILKVK